MTNPDTLYLDCFSGASGDMLLGALLDLGLDESILRTELAKLTLDPFDLQIETQTVSSIKATGLSVQSHQNQTLRTLSSITEILEHSTLDRDIISTSLQVFTKLAQAEATVHGLPIDKIHFHEVGALDTIIDIVGFIIGIKALGIKQIHCSELPLGRGFVRCDHGNLPLPAPAVCNLLQKVPVYGIEASYELVTPTGAAIISELSHHFGPLPPMTIGAVGYGRGTHPGSEDRPNLLRVISGRSHLVEESQVVDVIETNLDDWNSEGFPYLCEQLLNNNALDVSLTPLQMKKGRPGYCLRVICHPQHGMVLKDLILTETSAIGLRFRRENRYTLPREYVTVQTQWGPVQAKRVFQRDESVLYPEYEACRTIAEQYNVPLDQVYRAVIREEKRDNG
ncbi:MAG: nickel pincer cofactor biosynthesis protein LarC [Desulfobulbaceae bacterium]|nr:MAG: nickel pincer cofactor biosynthesis protein LarC [Desulfobulbaceae bacterium]